MQHQPQRQYMDKNNGLAPASSAVNAIKKIVPVFDPRPVPVVQVDTGLPAVAPASLSAANLRHAFSRHPTDWEPELRNERPWTNKPPAKAAVLVALVQRQELNVLLTVRSAQLSNHSGQIAFPGGRQDPEDHDARDTALREAWEEVGLERNRVEVIGSLPEYATGSGFEITPVIGLVTPPFAIAPNPAEVADVFEVPLSFLMNPAHHHWQQLESPELTRRWLSMPYDDPLTGHNRFIWGATAGMLRNLYRYLAFASPR